MLSRVSDVQISSQVSANLARAQVRLQELSEQASSGVKLNRPSDDPAGAGTVIRSHSIINALSQDTRAASFARGFLGAQDAVLDDADNIITRAREIAVQQANGVASDADRAAAATEVHELLSALVAVGNSELGGRRLFSSGEDAVPGAEPFTHPDDVGFDPANPYSGSTTPLQVEIGSGRLVRVTTTGSDVFGRAIAALDDLETRLQAGTDPSASLTELELSAADISTERSSIGARVQSLDERTGQIDRAELATKEIINETSGADIVGIVTSLVALQTQLQISAAASEQVLGANLASMLQV